MEIPYTYIQNLRLYNFRNYVEYEINCPSKNIVITGNNGAGKTNILESISLLSKGQGLRNSPITEMQNYYNDSYWVIHYKINSNGEDFSIGIARNNDKRTILINNKKQTNYKNLSSLINTIWLVPQLDHIFLKSPNERLKFFNRIINIFDENYANFIVRYEKAKRERTKLLQEKYFNNNWLDSIEQFISQLAINITLIRIKTLNFLQDIINNNIISSKLPKINIEIKSQVSELLERENSIENYQEKLKNYRYKDTITKRTNFGVHNDKFQLFNKEKNLYANNCSTGEQKLLLLTLILTSIIGKYTIHNKLPILLLDDIMSHLDSNYRDILLSIIIDIGCQTWITDVNYQNFKGRERYFECLHIEQNKI